MLVLDSILTPARYKHVLPLLDYFTINIYPFLSSGTKGVAMSNLTGPEMNFLNDQISALRSLAGAWSHSTFSHLLLAVCKV